MKKLLFLLLAGFTSPVPEQETTLPEGFVNVSDHIPTALIELRYTSKNNFMGRPVNGYQSRKCVLTHQATQALKAVQEELALQKMGIKIFDAYRPQRAVDHFTEWAKDLSDTAMKSSYYPKVKKSQLFEKGYIAARSSHSRGSTVDVTLVYLEDGKEVDMGTPYDYFSPVSWPTHTASISPAQFNNRMLLQKLMQKYGFLHLPTEWWHFTLNKEPFPNTYFDFVVR